MNSIRTAADVVDGWVCENLAGAMLEDSIWMVRLRGLALAGAALTLAMTAWKVIGPVTTSDLFLVAAGLLLLPRFELDEARRMWFPAVAVALIAVGGVIGTAVVSGSDVTGSADALGRLVIVSFGVMVLVVCWRPGLQQIKSFSWLWVAGGVISGMVALLIPNLHMFLRPAGLTPHPTHLAIVSLIVLGVALGLIASDRRRTQVLVGLAASALLFVAIVESGSRAGLVAAILVVLLSLIATRDRVAVIVASAVVVAGLALALLGAGGEDNALERLYRGDSASSEVRARYNDAAWERFKSDPVTGAGFADALEPHNFFLQMGSAAGVLGIAGAVMLVVLALRSYALAVWRRMPEHRAYWAMVAGLAAAVIGYLAASIFQNVLWDRNVWFAIVLMTWGVTAAVTGRSGPNISSPS